MKLRPAHVCILVLLPALLPAQTLDFNAARSADQLKAGVWSFHRGLFNEATLAFEKALSYQPTNILALTWLGRAEWRAGYEQEAARTWQQAVATGKAPSLVRDWISVLDFRRGLGRDLAGPMTWVVSSVLDAAAKDAYPFRRPTSVRPRADGTFWVVAFGTNEVLRYDANFRLLTSFKGGLQGFDKPFDLVENDDGTLFVSEYGANRIARVDSRGVKLGTFGAAGRGTGGLLGPQYLALDRRGMLWVTDWGNARVVRFSKDGTFMQALPGIDGPTGIAAHEDRLYVAEKNAKRVRIFDLNGNELGSVGSGTLEDPEGLSFTDDGLLLVADGNRILQCDLEQETWSVRGDASAWTKRLVQQAVTSNGSIMAVDFDENRVVLLTDTTSLATGLVVRIDRVNSAKFPEVFVDFSVTNRYGTPVVGLGPGNLVVTEARAAVGTPVLTMINTSLKAFDVALLVERSGALEALRGEVSPAVQDLYGLVTAGGRIKAVSASDRPVREADFGETRLRFVQKALQAPVSARWRFDLGVRLAGDELITPAETTKRAIVFFTSGSLGANPFGTYSVLELAAFLRNNNIALYPVVFGTGQPDEDLAWLASTTGGELTRASSAEGLPAVVKALRARVTAAYSLHYVSKTRPEFGDKYIPVEIEVTAQKVSGREESGYYAPPGAGTVTTTGTTAKKGE